MTYDQALAEQEYRRDQYQNFSLQNLIIFNTLLILGFGTAMYLL